MEIAAAAAMAASIFLLMAYIYHRSARRTSTLNAAGVAPGDKTGGPRRGRLSRLIRSAITRLGARLAPRHEESLARLLRQSASGISIHLLQGIRISAGVLAAMVGLPPGFPFSLLIVPVLFGLGYHLPVLLLKRKERAQMETLAGDLPEVADLMAVLCYSGVSLYRALQHSCSACMHTSSRREIEAVTERIALGESTAEALGYAAHHRCREMRRFGRTLLRAEEYGAPIAEILEGLAVELRSVRREKERVRSARASILILFPLVFLILPAFLLLTVGGMILGFTA